MAVLLHDVVGLQNGVDGRLQRLVRPRAGAAPRRHRADVEGRAAAVDRLDPHRARPGRAGARLRQVGRPAGRPRVAAGVVRACVDDDAGRASRARSTSASTPRCRSRSCRRARRACRSRVPSADARPRRHGRARVARRRSSGGAAARAPHRLHRREPSWLRRAAGACGALACARRRLRRAADHSRRGTSSPLPASKGTSRTPTCSSRSTSRIWPAACAGFPSGARVVNVSPAHLSLRSWAHDYQQLHPVERHLSGDVRDALPALLEVPVRRPDEARSRRAAARLAGVRRQQAAWRQEAAAPPQRRPLPRAHSRSISAGSSRASAGRSYTARSAAGSGGCGASSGSGSISAGTAGAGSATGGCLDRRRARAAA